MARKLEYLCIFLILDQPYDDHARPQTQRRSGRRL